MMSSIVSVTGDCATAPEPDIRYPAMDKARGPRAAVGLRMYAARMAKGVKQKVFAKDLGLPDARTLWRWEYGHQLPDTETFALIAAALGTTVEWLLNGGEGGPVPDPAPGGALDPAVVARQEGQTRKQPEPKIESVGRRAAIAESARNADHWLYDMFESRGISEDEARFEEVIDELVATAGRYEITPSIARTVFKLFQRPSPARDPDPNDEPERGANERRGELTRDGDRTMLPKGKGKRR